MNDTSLAAYPIPNSQPTSQPRAGCNSTVKLEQLDPAPSPHPTDPGSTMVNFEPANPPLLDPFLLQHFSLEEMERELRRLQHRAVLKRLADFIPNRPTTVIHHRPMPAPKPAPTLPPVTVQPITDSSCQSPAKWVFHNGYSKPKPKPTKRFTLAQATIMEEFYQQYGSGRISDRHELANRLGLYKNDVIGWFQSRRRKDRRAHEASSWWNRNSPSQYQPPKRFRDQVS